MNTVLVFRTSVVSQREVEGLQPLLNKIIVPGGQWNFDLEDCDNILRVEAPVPEAVAIIAALRIQGFSCEEL